MTPDGASSVVSGLSVKTLVQAEMMSVQGQHRHEFHRDKPTLDMVSQHKIFGQSSDLHLVDNFYRLLKFQNFARLAKDCLKVCKASLWLLV